MRRGPGAPDERDPVTVRPRDDARAAPRRAGGARRRRRGSLLGPAPRLALGLVAMMVSTLILTDFFVSGFMPSRADEARHNRQLVAQLAAARVAEPLAQSAVTRLREALAETMQTAPDLRSIALRGRDVGDLVAGDHARHWTLAPQAEATLDQIRVPLRINGEPWGELQLAFAPVLPATVRGWLSHPLVLGGGLMAVLAFVGFQLYLRRAMRYLDPEAAVPDRVKAAFDTLIEGVLVIDRSGHVMLANALLYRLQPEPDTVLAGRPVDSLDWLTAPFLDEGKPLPWESVLAGKGASLGHHIRIAGPAGRGRTVVLNCSPVDNGQNRIQGCLLTLSDVTELEERTARLQAALAQLSASQAEIQRKNQELTRLATRDSLTGVLNRRTFMDQANARIAEAARSGRPIGCVMCDIDHFKSINDRFGHAAGDRVIQAAAAAIQSALREADRLGRYGGEEFCVLLVGLTLEQGAQIAERIRARVEAEVASAVPDAPDRLKVTMSFGVALYDARQGGLAELIDRADQALYHAKRSGRNRVATWAGLLQARQAALAFQPGAELPAAPRASPGPPRERESGLGRPGAELSATAGPSDAGSGG